MRCSSSGGDAHNQFHQHNPRGLRLKSDSQPDGMARMKQTKDARILFPRKPPRTILAMQRWHQKLLWDCVFFEFKKKALEAALNLVRTEVSRFVMHVRERAGLETQARLALEQLNHLREELAGELTAAKHAVRMIHDTNEVIIGSLIQAHPGGKELCRELQRHPVLQSTNLLHGDGWLRELLTAAQLRREGKAAFVTFGTLFDPAKFDVVAFERPLRRIRWNLVWPRKQKSPKKVIQRRTSAST